MWKMDLAEKNIYEIDYLAEFSLEFEILISTDNWSKVLAKMVIF